MLMLPRLASIDKSTLPDDIRNLRSLGNGARFTGLFATSRQRGKDLCSQRLKPMSHGAHLPSRARFRPFEHDRVAAMQRGLAMGRLSAVAMIVLLFRRSPRRSAAEPWLVL